VKKAQRAFGLLEDGEFGWYVVLGKAVDWDMVVCFQFCGTGPVSFGMLGDGPVVNERVCKLLRVSGLGGRRGNWECGSE
jgi:hypothetical protein